MSTDLTNFPTQPSAYSLHTPGSSTRHHVLYQGSVGLTLEEEIIEVLKKIWQDKKIEVGLFPVIELEHPADISHGDYACNVALQLAKALKKSPRDIACLLVEELQKRSLKKLVKKIEVAGPGFINFFLAEDWLLKQVEVIFKAGDSYGVSDIGRNRKILIEHSNPNTSKPAHVGHMRNMVLGLPLVRLYEALGYEVINTNIYNDRGIALSKVMCGYLFSYGSPKRTDFLNWPQLLHKWQENPQNWATPKSQNLKADFLVGQAYVEGERLCQDNSEAMKASLEMLQAWEEKDPACHQLWQQINDWFYEGFERTMDRLGSKVDIYSYESEIYERGAQIVQDHLEPNGPLKKLADGAVVAPLEEYCDLPNKVLMRADGTSIYMTCDLALTKERVERFKADSYVWVVASEQYLYFQQLFATCKMLGLVESLDQLFHMSFGMVFLPSGKMSSRKGRVVYCDDILNQMVDRALEKVEERYSDFSVDEKKELAEKIGIGAVRYAILKFDSKQDITFDPETTLSFSGNSGPYLQYVGVRIKSLLDKAYEDDPDLKLDEPQKSISKTGLQDQELHLLRKLYLLPETIIRSALDFKPNYLCQFLFETAQLYNDFYLHCPVLQADEKEVRQRRLYISKTTYQVLKNGLDILGIEIPKRM